MLFFPKLHLHYFNPDLQKLLQLCFLLQRVGGRGGGFCFSLIKHFCGNNYFFPQKKMQGKQCQKKAACLTVTTLHHCYIFHMLDAVSQTRCSSHCSEKSASQKPLQQLTQCLAHGGDCISTFSTTIPFRLSERQEQSHLPKPPPQYMGFSLILETLTLKSREGTGVNRST